MLPVRGLPPHVTVQSTPALRLSPEGVMLNCRVSKMASWVTAPAFPLELVTEIEPAFAAGLELLLHPALTRPSARQTRSAESPWGVRLIPRRHRAPMGNN